MIAPLMIMLIYVNNVLKKVIMIAIGLVFFQIMMAGGYYFVDVEILNI
jgi:hypothetical protein